MSGPVTAGEATALESAEAPVVPTAEVEITESVVSQVGVFSGRRALPRRSRRRASGDVEEAAEASRMTSLVVV
jgi:hypothetical protein